MSPRLLIVIGALIAGLMLPASAEAALMRATTDLNMRTTPGGSRIAVIPGGAWVDVTGYSGGWCRVAWAGYYGWSSCRYLAGYAPTPRYVYPEPRVGIYLGFPLRPWIFDYDRDYRPYYRPAPRTKYLPRYPWYWRHDDHD
jgi:uncharacterized protein YraI